MNIAFLEEYRTFKNKIQTGIWKKQCGEKKKKLCIPVIWSPSPLYCPLWENFPATGKLHFHSSVDVFTAIISMSIYTMREFWVLSARGKGCQSKALSRFAGKGIIVPIMFQKRFLKCLYKWMKGNTQKCQQQLLRMAKLLMIIPLSVFNVSEINSTQIRHFMGWTVSSEKMLKS